MSPISINPAALVIVEIYSFMSGNSSVAIPVATGSEYLGTLAEVAPNVVAIMSDGVEVARMKGCYTIGELCDGRDSIDGWQDDSNGFTWSRWAITY